MKQVNIYCIEDINGLKYVGSTIQKLEYRLTRHKLNKKYTERRQCSSSKLNLDKCEIYSLEVCNELDRKERERYWINKIDCVNERKLNFHREEWEKNYNKQWRDNHKKHLNEYQKEYIFFRKKNIVDGCYEFIKMLEEF